MLERVFKGVCSRVCVRECEFESVNSRVVYWKKNMYIPIVGTRILPDDVVMLVT